MVSRISPRKKKQIDRFFSDGKKTLRLRTMADRARRSLKNFVLVANIAGKKRVAKISSTEIVSKGNILLLQREHKKAVKNGTIKPNYFLSVVKYVHVGPKVGIMEKVPGFGLLSLERVLDAINEPRHSFDFSKKEFQPILKFLKKHPKITLESIRALNINLTENMKKISQNRTIFSHDLDGINNIIVTGVDKKTGNFKITLVDQCHPYYSSVESLKAMVARGLNKGSNHSKK